MMLHGKSETLNKAIQDLYKVFSRYPLPKYTNPCLYCHSVADDVALRSKSLQEIDISDLRDYAVDAIYDWGNVECFKHFLPRIFELFMSDPDPASSFTYPEMLFGKFRYGHWREWPPEEQAAVEAFLHAVWNRVLNDPPPAGSYSDLESWICSIAQCEDDLSSYLLDWIQDESLSACLALSSFLITSNITDGSGNERNAFWAGREEQYSQIKIWVKSEAVIKKLRVAESQSADENDAREFAFARDLSRS